MANTLLVLNSSSDVLGCTRVASPTRAAYDFTGKSQFKVILKMRNAIQPT